MENPATHERLFSLRIFFEKVLYCIVYLFGKLFVKTCVFTDAEIFLDRPAELRKTAVAK